MISYIFLLLNNTQIIDNFVYSVGVIMIFKNHVFGFYFSVVYFLCGGTLFGYYNYMITTQEVKLENKVRSGTLDPNCAF